MRVTAWNNGSYHRSGAGYGLKVRAADRDNYFDRSVRTVAVHLPGKATAIRVNIGKPSFWNGTCRELISREIGIWLLESGYAPWPPGLPPEFDLIPNGPSVFHLEPDVR